MVKTIEWWRGISTHMWRTYFALVRDGFVWENLSAPDQKFYAICNHILLKRFSPHDQDILRMYYTSRWGYDQHAVEDYSLRNDIPTRVIWMVIRRANREVMYECGFLERKDEYDNDQT